MNVSRCVYRGPESALRLTAASYDASAIRSPADLAALSRRLFNLVYTQTDPAVALMYKIGGFELLLCFCAATLIIYHKLRQRTFWLVRRQRGLIVPNGILSFCLMLNVFLLIYISLVLLLAFRHSRIHYIDILAGQDRADAFIPSLPLFVQATPIAIVTGAVYLCLGASYSIPDERKREPESINLGCFRHVRQIVHDAKSALRRFFSNNTAFVNYSMLSVPLLLSASIAPSAIDATFKYNTAHRQYSEFLRLYRTVCTLDTLAPVTMPGLTAEAVAGEGVVSLLLRQAASIEDHLEQSTMQMVVCNFIWVFWGVLISLRLWTSAFTLLRCIFAQLAQLQALTSASPGAELGTIDEDDIITARQTETPLQQPFPTPSGRDSSVAITVRPCSTVTEVEARSDFGPGDPRFHPHPYASSAALGGSMTAIDSPTSPTFHQCAVETIPENMLEQAIKSPVSAISRRHRSYSVLPPPNEILASAFPPVKQEKLLPILELNNGKKREQYLRRVARVYMAQFLTMGIASTLYTVAHLLSNVLCLAGVKGDQSRFPYEVLIVSYLWITVIGSTIMTVSISGNMYEPILVASFVKLSQRVTGSGQPGTARTSWTRPPGPPSSRRGGSSSGRPKPKSIRRSLSYSQGAGEATFIPLSSMSKRRPNTSSGHSLKERRKAAAAASMAMAAARMRSQTALASTKTHSYRTFSRAVPSVSQKDLLTRVPSSTALPSERSDSAVSQMDLSAAPALPSGISTQRSGVTTAEKELQAVAPLVPASSEHSHSATQGDHN